MIRFLFRRLGRLHRKARGLSDLLNALIPILPRGLGTSLRRGSRSVRRSGRRAGRISKALDNLTR